MQKIAVTLLLFTLISNSACADSDNVVATYSGGKVTENQVMKQFKPMLDVQPESKGKKFSELDKKLQEELVKGFITQQLVEKQIDKSGIRDTDEFKQQIKLAEQNLLQEELLKRQIEAAVTDKAVNEEYNQLVQSKKGKKEIKVGHILVDNEKKAKKLKEKLDKGSKFADIAKESSKDEGSKNNGGEIGYILKGQLVPEFESVAFAMKKGEISAPVKTQFGWHIITVLDSRDAKAPTKEEADPMIRNKLSREAIKNYLTGLTKDAKIEMKTK